MRTSQYIGSPQRQEDENESVQDERRSEDRRGKEKMSFGDKKMGVGMRE